MCSAHGICILWWCLWSRCVIKVQRCKPHSQAEVGNEDTLLLTSCLLQSLLPLNIGLAVSNIALLFLQWNITFTFFIVCLGMFTQDTQYALNQIESTLSAFTLNEHLPNPDLIQINLNRLPEVVSIQIELDRAVALYTWGPKKAWHSRSCQLPTVSALLQATHCVPRVCLTWEAICWLAEVKIWRGRHGSCVEVWPLEVNVHAWIRFRTMQCGRDRCALDSHWICIGQFGYWTGLNPDSVWTGL